MTGPTIPMKSAVATAEAAIQDQLRGMGSGSVGVPGRAALLTKLARYAKRDDPPKKAPTAIGSQDPRSGIMETARTQTVQPAR